MYRSLNEVFAAVIWYFPWYTVLSPLIIFQILRRVQANIHPHLETPDQIAVYFVTVLDSDQQPLYRYLYIAGADEPDMYPFRRIVKLNMDTGTRDSWLAPKGNFLFWKLSLPCLVSKSHISKDIFQICNDGLLTTLIPCGTFLVIFGLLSLETFSRSKLTNSSS